MTPMQSNITHDGGERSWVESANAPDGDFPIQNLPFAIFHRDANQPFRGGAAIGDQVLDLAAARPGQARPGADRIRKRNGSYSAGTRGVKSHELAKPHANRWI